MKTFELTEKLKQVMLDTGRGSRPVVFVDPEGIAFEVNDVVFDAETNSFVLHGEPVDDGD